MAAEPPVLEAGELNVGYLRPEDQPLVDAFTCSTSTGAALSRFLREDALREQEENLSTTYVFTPDDRSRLDAFVTLSATGIKAPTEYQKRFPDRYIIPAVMIDFLAVHDERRGQGLGLRIFQWVEAKVHPLNAICGVRFIALDVYASDWLAYRRYANEDWGFKALPLKLDSSHKEEAREAPDPKGEPPAWLRPNRLIPMIYDLVDHNGPSVLPPTLAQIHW